MTKYTLYKGVEGWAVVPEGAIGFEVVDNQLVRWVYDEQEFVNNPYVDVMESFSARQKFANDTNVVSTAELEQEFQELKIKERKYGS